MDDFDVFYALMLSLYVFYNLFLWPFLFLFIKRRDTEPIKSRQWQLAVFQTIIGFLFFTYLLIGPWNTGCFIDMLRMVGLPLWTYPYFIRGFVLWGNHVLQDTLMWLQARKLKGDSNQTPLEESFSQEMKTRTHSTDVSGLELELESDEPKNVKVKSPRDNNGGLKVRAVGRRPPRRVGNLKFKTALLLCRRKWLLSLKFQFAVLFFIFLCFFCSLLYVYFGAPSIDIPVHTRLDRYKMCEKISAATIALAEYAIGLGSMFLFCVLLWNVRDNYLVKTELTAVCILTCILFPLWYLSDSKFFPDVVGRQFFTALEMVTFSVATLVVPVIASYRYQRILDRDKQESQGEIGEVIGIEIIRCIFKNKVLTQSFSTFCQQSWCYENFLFIENVLAFRVSSRDEMERDAKKIWSVYLDPNSDTEVNIEDGIRERILEKIQQGMVDRDLFIEAEVSIGKLLRFSVYPLWINSSNYQEALKKTNLSSVIVLLEKK